MDLCFLSNSKEHIIYLNPFVLFSEPTEFPAIPHMKKIIIILDEKSADIITVQYKIKLYSR